MHIVAGGGGVGGELDAAKRRWVDGRADVVRDEGLVADSDVVVLQVRDGAGPLIAVVRGRSGRD